MKNKLILISAVFVSFLLILLAMIVLPNLKKSVSTTTMPFGATPTPIANGQQSFRTATNALGGSEFPKNNTKDINVNTGIAFTFNISLPPEKMDTTTYQITPAIIGTTSWDSNTFSFVPTNPLSPNQTYTISLSSPGFHTTWKFTTGEASSSTDVSASQTAGDEQFSKVIQDNITRYPWLDRLPVSGIGFFAYFDTAKRSFVVDLYPTKASSVPIAKQVEILKQKVGQEIINLGINPSSYPFEWKITPVSE